MEKQRLLHILLVSVLLLTLSGMVCHAAEPGRKAAVSGGKKKLLLFAKNPSTWFIVKEGANGKLIYHESSGIFTLNAAGLMPLRSYTFVRYADTPPQVEILAARESDKLGRLELSGIWHNWTKKFWLVSSEDVKGKAGKAGVLTAWHPDRYLFEEKLLGIDCICPEPEEPQ
jgi:hypothetical protein